MRPALLGAGVVLLSASAACSSEYHPEYHPQSVYTVEQNVSYGATIFQGGSGPTRVEPRPPTESPAWSRSEPDTQSVPVEAPVPRVNPSRVLVAESTHLDRPTEVLGVVDLAVPIGSHEASLTLLRRRAAEMGADAVVGVEFHGGEREGQVTHLSGLAVRFLRGGHSGG
jgi:hypothetical protein